MKQLLFSLFILMFLACGETQKLTETPDLITFDQEHFVTRWKVGDDLIVKITTHLNYDYFYNIDCEGDGEWDGENITGDYLCVYDSPGIYQVVIVGDFPHFRGYYAGGDLITVDNWGLQPWKSFEGSFISCDLLERFEAKDTPYLKRVENMNYIFWGAGRFNGDLSGWDTSNVKYMNMAFYNATSFNGDISGWDVSEVTHHDKFSNSIPENKQPAFKSKK